MSSVASLRERKSIRIDYKNLHLGKPGRNMAAEENGDFTIEEEMTPVRTRLFKSNMLYRRPRQRMAIVMMMMMIQN